jgi:hypothetical protein
MNALIIITHFFNYRIVYTNSDAVLEFVCTLVIIGKTKKISVNLSETQKPFFSDDQNKVDTS